MQSILEPISKKRRVGGGANLLEVCHGICNSYLKHMLDKGLLRSYNPGSLAGLQRSGSNSLLWLFYIALIFLKEQKHLSSELDPHIIQMFRQKHVNWLVHLKSIQGPFFN